jgi:hypothetical protein
MDQVELHGGWWPDYISHHGSAWDDRTHYHYMRDQLLVTHEDLRRVRDELARRGVRIRRERPEERLGIVLLELDEQTSAHDERLQVPALVDELQDAEEVVSRVAPNHVLGPCGHIVQASSTPGPLQNGQELPPPHQPLHGGPIVAVLDTGVDPDNEWLKGRCKGDPEKPILDAHGRLVPNSGHGTFVAGIVLRHARNASVLVRRVVDDNGIANELMLAGQLERLADSDADVVNVSVGSYTRNDQGMLAIDRALRWLFNRKPDMVIIASAGNEGASRPFFPAADKRVIAVGAVERDAGSSRWKRAEYSNYGWWVDACAPGTDVVSTFFHYRGPVIPVDNDTDADECGASASPGGFLSFDGKATWSGTSFAVPMVAAAIASRIGEGASGREAIAAVIEAPDLPALPDLGTLVIPESDDPTR